MNNRRRQLINFNNNNNADLSGVAAILPEININNISLEQYYVYNGTVTYNNRTISYPIIQFIYTTKFGVVVGDTSYYRIYCLVDKQDGTFGIGYYSFSKSDIRNWYSTTVTTITNAISINYNKSVTGTSVLENIPTLDGIIGYIKGI